MYIYIFIFFLIAQFHLWDWEIKSTIPYNRKGRAIAWSGEG